MASKTLTGKAWNSHLEKNNLAGKDVLEVYHSTHRHERIYQLAGYFFCFRFARGYADLSALKTALNH